MFVIKHYEATTGILKPRMPETMRKEERVIELENVSYSYPTTPNALKNITLKVGKGEIIGVIGPNGAGKSTLLKTLNGLVPQFYGGEFKGRVVICGMSTEEHSVAELTTKVGLVFQNPEDQLSGVATSVYEEVAFGLSMLGFPHEVIREKVLDSIKKVGLSGFENRSPFSLSGGEQQRLAIATVLAIKPEVLVLDEPVAQLDPIGKSEVLNVIKQLKKEKLTIVIAEHEIEELATFVDRIIVLYNGGITATGSTKDVLTKVEMLKNIGIDSPSVTELTYVLNNEYGFSFKDSPINLSEAIKIYKALGNLK